ncbi:hypothetical protein [Allorhodopirellula heiligendammensis]|uniref:Uncharacterized protein n=1 Tax=Allorhodopirellula heiligendammensis TaxID=2714739 RepID=A0A5C6BVJ4_9BACT|nr:hypothetical protein [Allorhodopirellula heiligendammensis]TWU16300.1 hypothetical protein Poly21_35050 [Allorhodopirellula heiligendammensis]
MTLKGNRQLLSSAWLDGCLRIVIAIQSIGLSGRYLFSKNEWESHVFEWLLFDWGWPEPLAQTMDNAGTWLTLVAGGLLCLIGWLKHRRFGDTGLPTALTWLDRIAAGWIACWLLVMAVAHMMRATLWAELTLAEDAVRYIAPVTLIILSGRPAASPLVKGGRSGGTPLAVLLLMIAASATFAAHGYKAVERYGPFTDLILLSDLQWTHMSMSQTTAETILVVVGVIDLVVALLLIPTRWRSVALYMAVWGIIAAVSRMTAYGFGAWPETLLRAANGGVPLAIFGYWTISRASRLQLPRETSESETHTLDETRNKIQIAIRR